MSKSIEAAANTLPSKQQYEWQTTEFYAFVHFGVNTFTDREWGEGTEDPAIFNPTKLNADQWVNAAKSAGMRGLILTCKHHDGFCLWPSKYTEHSVKSSPYKNGAGDVVREVSDACKKGGLKFGVYLSPWDRHEKTYGSGAAYDEYYKNQLTELLTRYGEIFEIWFDGACGEGPNGKKQEYDWKQYLEVCHALQPNAVTFNVGDIRWCGNEAGQTREAEWSVLPMAASSREFVFRDVQNTEDFDGAFRARGINIDSLDLGSREVIEGETKFIWYPCETDTSIRPGWFYHAHEDGKVRPLDELLDIYYKSVGGNSSLLLNIPPNKDGLFHPNDVARLAEIGARLKEDFAVNFAENTEPALSREGETDVISLKLADEAEIGKVVIMEDIKKGQRIEEFEIYANGGLLYKGKTIGYKKIAVLKNPVTTGCITIKITKSRLLPEVNFVGIY
ncbi:MAG: alpha-L-fucosidase [Oscillospiraceae bacterium]|nr:alpha-L-fucosidase [Oscillospiraceae bacterium]